MQSHFLTWVVGTVLLAAVLWSVLSTDANGLTHSTMAPALIVSLCLALLSRLARAATLPASILGGLLCFVITWRTGEVGASVFASGFTPLLTLSVLTFVTTRIARHRVGTTDAAERHGRRASQIVANIGWAGLVLVPQLFYSTFPGAFDSPRGVLVSKVMLLAALAEAAADTVASEIGQAFGGTPRMLGSWRRVEPGTDGAITCTGSAAGVLAAVVVAAIGCPALRLSTGVAIVASLAAVAGFVMDSLLGATAERRGWLGNDLVNFCSTGTAALFALFLLRAGQSHPH